MSNVASPQKVHISVGLTVLLWLSWAGAQMSCYQTEEVYYAYVGKGKTYKPVTADQWAKWVSEQQSVGKSEFPKETDPTSLVVAKHPELQGPLPISPFRLPNKWLNLDEDVWDKFSGVWKLLDPVSGQGLTRLSTNAPPNTTENFFPTYDEQLMKHITITNPPKKFKDAVRTCPDHSSRWPKGAVRDGKGTMELSNCCRLDYSLVYIGPLLKETRRRSCGHCTGDKSLELVHQQNEDLPTQTFYTPASLDLAKLAAEASGKPLSEMCYKKVDKGSPLEPAIQFELSTAKKPSECFLPVTYIERPSACRISDCNSGSNNVYSIRQEKANKKTCWFRTSDSETPYFVDCYWDPNYIPNSANAIAKDEELRDYACYVTEDPVRAGCVPKFTDIKSKRNDVGCVTDVEQFSLSKQLDHIRGIGTRRLCITKPDLSNEHVRDDLCRLHAQEDPVKQRMCHHVSLTGADGKERGPTALPEYYEYEENNYYEDYFFRNFEWNAADAAPPSAALVALLVAQPFI